MMLILENCASAFLNIIPLIKFDSKNLDAIIHAFKKCQWISFYNYHFGASYSSIGFGCCM